MTSAAVVLASFLVATPMQVVLTGVVEPAPSPVSVNVALTDSLITVNLSQVIRVRPDRATAWIVVEGFGDTPSAAIERMSGRLKIVSDTLAHWSRAVVPEPAHAQGVLPSSSQGYPAPPQPQSYVARSALRVTIVDLESLPRLEAALHAAGAGSLVALVYESSTAESAWTTAAWASTQRIDSIAAQTAQRSRRSIGDLVDMAVSGPHSYQAPTQLPMDPRMGYQGRPAPEVVLQFGVLRRYRILRR